MQPGRRHVRRGPRLQRFRRSWHLLHRQAALQLRKAGLRWVRDPRQAQDCQRVAVV